MIVWKLCKQKWGTNRAEDWGFDWGFFYKSIKHDTVMVAMSFLLFKYIWT